MELADIAFYLALSAVVTFLASLIYPTRSPTRQGLYLASYAAIAIAAIAFLLDYHGAVPLLGPQTRGYLVIGALGYVGVAIMVVTLDLYVNFETLKDDRAYAMLGRRGLAAGLMLIAVGALVAISTAWYQVDPTIFEPRANIAYLTAAGADGRLTMTDQVLFALDQTQKALLFDVSEVYRVGLIDIGNNPTHYAFSTACLIYRTFLSVFVVVIVVRLVR